MRTSGIVRGQRLARRRRVDPIEVVDAVYRLDLDAQSWLAGVAEALAPRFNADFPAVSHLSTLGPLPSTAQNQGGEARPHPAAGSTGEREDVLRRILAVDMPADESLITAFTFTAKQHDLASLHEYSRLLRSYPLFSHSELVGRVPRWRGMMLEAGKRGGIALADAIGFFATGGLDTFLAVLGASRDELRTTPRERRSWLPLSKHVGAALRLRERLGLQTRGRCLSRDPLVESIFDPDGTLHDAWGEARDRSARRALRDAVLSMERARLANGLEDPRQALELWQDLIAGRWSLVERFDTDGRRLLVAYRNEVDIPDLRRLRPREQEVLRLATEGYASKEIAYALDISESAVSQQVASLLRKFRATSLAELTVLSGAVMGQRADGYQIPRGDDSAPRDLRVLSNGLPGLPDQLTGSEKAVIQLLLSGRSRTQIAHARGVSLNTVHNQLASAYRKLGVRSLRELAAKGIVACAHRGPTAHAHVTDQP